MLQLLKMVFKRSSKRGHFPTKVEDLRGYKSLEEALLSGFPREMSITLFPNLRKVALLRSIVIS